MVTLKERTILCGRPQITKVTVTGLGSIYTRYTLESDAAKCAMQTHALAFYGIRSLENWDMLDLYGGCISHANPMHMVE